MARKLQNVSAALVAEIVETRCPALNDAYQSIVAAARLQSKATDAADAVKESREQQGLTDDNLFGKVKAAGIEAAAAKLPGGSVMGFWEYRLEQDGLKANTGKAYARMAGYISDALQAKEYSVEEVMAATRPELQDMFASEEARARTAVRFIVAELVKGATREFCDQLASHVKGFEFIRDAAPNETATEAADALREKLEAAKAAKKAAKKAN